MTNHVCDHCGNTFEKPRYHTRNKHVYCSKTCGWAAKVTHGQSNKTPEYMTWTDMRRRCLNQKAKDYPKYGGRGITICDRWINSYENFLDDMGKRPGADYSIERIDNDGNYEPSNCKWGTKLEQSRNRRGIYTPEQDAKLRQYVERGLTTPQIAKLIGKSPGSVTSRICRIGLAHIRDPRHSQMIASQEPSP